MKIKNLYHHYVRKFPNLFGLIYSLVFLFFVKQLSVKKNYKKKFLILNKERFWHDLKELDKSEEIEFLYFDKEKISLLTEPYLKTIRKKMPSTFWTDYKDETFFNNYLEEHSKFIYYFLRYLNLFLKFDTLITPSLWYLQDRAFEKAANNLKKKLIFLHKENTIDLHFYDRILEKWKKKLINFENNSLVVVYNNNTKKILSDSKKIKTNKVFSLGCPRIDALTNFKNNEPKKITLISFRYNLGSNMINQNVRHPFLSNDTKLVEFFNNVHNIFIDLATKYINTEFIIKIKHEGTWRILIEDLKKNFENKLNYKINNLKIISDELSMGEILKDSKVVCGINSLGLAEARILGIPCFIPVFDEISEYKDRFYFQKYFGNELTPIKNQIELYAEIEKKINSKFKKNYSENNKKFIEEYFGYNDGKNTKRYINFLLNNQKFN